MVFLTASGRDLRAWAVLEPQSGGFCNFLTIHEGDGANALQIAETTAHKPCPEPQIGCLYCVDGMCAIDLAGVTANISTLKAKRVIAVDDDGMARSVV